MLRVIYIRYDGVIRRNRIYDSASDQRRLYGLEGGKYLAAG